MKNVIIRHKGQAGLDHVTGDIFGLGAMLTHCKVWTPNVIRISSFHSPDPVVRWLDLLDPKSIPANVHVVKHTELPHADVMVDLTLDRRWRPVQAVIDEINRWKEPTVAVKVCYVVGTHGASFLKPSAKVKHIAAQAAKRLGTFALIHLRMTDKVGHAGFDQRLFKDEKVTPMINKLIPVGSPVYLMTDDNSPRHKFPQLFKDYAIKTYKDIPELAAIKQNNYLLYSVERCMAHLATHTVSNSKKFCPSGINLTDLL